MFGFDSAILIAFALLANKKPATAKWRVQVNSSILHFHEIE
jgi:hypothetical protein